MKLTAAEKNAAMSTERATLTKLLEAALEGNFARLKETVDEYCKAHQDVTPTEVLTQFKDGKKRTALHFACQSQAPASKGDEPDIVESMLCSSWLPNSCVHKMLRMKDIDGLTPLMLAVQVADVELAEKRTLILLKIPSEDGQKSKLGLARSHAGATALHYAAAAGASAEAIKELFGAGQVALKTSSLQGGTPLHWVCAVHPPKNYTETIRALLDCGADLNSNVSEGSTMIPPPLLLALAAGNDCHGRCLVEEAYAREIDLAVTLSFNLPGKVSVYHVAADMNMVGTLALLLERADRDAISNLKNEKEQTPLDLAAQEGHVGCVLLLLPGDSQTEEAARLFTKNAQAQRTNNVSESPTMSNKPSTEGNVENSDKSGVETRAQTDAAAILASSSDVTEESKRTAQELKSAGNEKFTNKDWSSALDLYTQAIQSDPTDATFYSNRSACYLQLKKPEDALYDAVVARHLRPDWPKAAYRMAMARLELGRFEDAALSAWEGLQQDQDNNELKELLQKCVKKGRKEHLEVNRKVKAS